MGAARKEHDTSTLQMGSIKERMCCYLLVFREDMFPLAVYGWAREVCSTALKLDTTAAGMSQAE
jgi:hypothetical protein